MYWKETKIKQLRKLLNNLYTSYWYYSKYSYYHAKIYIHNNILSLVKSTIILGGEPKVFSRLFWIWEPFFVETISWRIFNQPIIIQTICNQSHDNGNGINHSQRQLPRTNYAAITLTTTQQNKLNSLIYVTGISSLAQRFWTNWITRTNDYFHPSICQLFFLDSIFVSFHFRISPCATTTYS